MMKKNSANSLTSKKTKKSRVKSEESRKDKEMIETQNKLTKYNLTKT